jgi:hypothetical protein
MKVRVWDQPVAGLAEPPLSEGCEALILGEPRFLGFRTSLLPLRSLLAMSGYFCFFGSQRGAPGLGDGVAKVEQ